MTDDLAVRYEALRVAAAEVVHSALGHRPPLPYTAELHDLHRLLLAAESPEKPTRTDTPDPARYSLAFTDHREDGTSGPYELAALAAEVREDLAGDRQRGEHLPENPVRDVHLTQLRAMVVSSLLHELAARLRPGPAAGLADEGRDLAEIADDLGTRLLNMTSAGS